MSTYRRGGEEEGQSIRKKFIFVAVKLILSETISKEYIFKSQKV